MAEIQVQVYLFLPQNSHNINKRLKNSQNELVSQKSGKAKLKGI